MPHAAASEVRHEKDAHITRVEWGWIDILLLFLTRGRTRSKRQRVVTYARLYVRDTSRRFVQPVPPWVTRCRSYIYVTATLHFKTKCLISSSAFHLFYLLDKTCFEIWHLVLNGDITPSLRSECEIKTVYDLCDCVSTLSLSLTHTHAHKSISDQI